MPIPLALLSQIETPDFNYEGFAAVADVFIYIVTHPGWLLSVILFFGFIALLNMAIIRFILHSFEIGNERDRMRAKGVFMKTALYAGALYLIYIFLYQTIFPPDLTVLFDLFQHLPLP